MAATAALIAASLLALALAWALERRVPLVPLITAAVVAVFGGLTLWLQDETFIKMKPTIVQAVFAAGPARRPGVRPAAPEAAARRGDAADERSRLAAVHAALRAVLPRHGGAQRAGLANPVDRLLGHLQGVRPAGPDHPVHPRADAVRRPRDAHGPGGGGSRPEPARAKRPPARAPRAGGRWRRPRRPQARHIRPRHG